MKYRDAKKLQNGDEVVRKSDNLSLTVKDIEVYGQHRIVKMNCVTVANVAVSVFNDEVE